MAKTLLLNRYELLEKIGEGGMGIVYKARCTILDRLVAIKILKTELNNSKEFIHRFKLEANSIAKLSHSNIVNVYDAGSENDINFIVMEYINGKTLKQIIKENIKLSFSETLDIAFQISKALECAHKHNIIHRDIKPDNILITKDNIVKLTDFGIAKITDSVTLTYPNKIIGSIHYFSPEQAKGKLVDYRTDIYSLGIVMYEMITGKVPFKAELPISVAMMHIQEPVTPPIEIFSSIPENLNKVILKTLEKDPINRFQTAKELSHILNLIKENSKYKFSFKNKSFNDTTIVMENKSFNDSNIMLESDTLLCDSKIDSTDITTKACDQETLLLKNDKNNKALNSNSKKNKKIILISTMLVSAIFIGALCRYTLKESSKNVDVPSFENTDIPDSEIIVNEISEENNDSLEENNIPVPSLIGNTQDIAEKIIISNGFLLGNITQEYSNTIPKDIIISQSPLSNTLYEKNTKINLVISLGEKITEPVVEVNEYEKVTDVINNSNTGNNGNGNGNGKEKGNGNNNGNGNGNNNNGNSNNNGNGNSNGKGNEKSNKKEKEK